MYLKALEIQGFKSFPEKTRLSFEKDITVIVGPNGSGKSNISDALLWVMGEQKTRMLRGGKMEDVIFGGTEKRGAMGFAQVTLVLDNSVRVLQMDADEVTISRRYYRSGESEYYINREPVRLRDVTAASARSSPPSPPTGGRSLRRRRVSPVFATGRTIPSASWPGRRKTCCASATRSPSWSFRWGA